jgi:hypothetical protein
MLESGHAVDAAHSMLTLREPALLRRGQPTSKLRITNGVRREVCMRISTCVLARS